MEVEQGSEVFIPRELAQKQLPLSFRFYDPILKMVQELICDDKKDFFVLKSVTALEVLKKVDAQKRFLEKMGFQDTQDEDMSKLTFKHQAVNKRDENYINVLNSLHSKAV